jgi:hypothetical protein
MGCRPGSSPPLAVGLHIEGGELVFSCEENTEISNNDRYGIILTNGARFILQAGLKISGNEGGVWVSTLSSFTMETGAEITGNTNPGYWDEVKRGGGVYVDTIVSSDKSTWDRVATFTMKPGAKITNNTATYGGGVYVGQFGIFNMEGGEISGNTASYGGGVYVNFNFPEMFFPGSFASFTKHTGAIIYGSGDGDMSNVAAANGKGHSVLTGTSIYRDTTVMPDQSLHIKRNNGTIVEQTGDWTD